VGVSDFGEEGSNLELMGEFVFTLGEHLLPLQEVLLLAARPTAFREVAQAGIDDEVERVDLYRLVVLLHALHRRFKFQVFLKGAFGLILEWLFSEG